MFALGTLSLIPHRRHVLLPYALAPLVVWRGVVGGLHIPPLYSSLSLFTTLYRIEYDPSEARVWVVSSGTENTVFSWSVWRRLPLHEVRKLYLARSIL